MSISEICIRRPVFTWVLAACPVVLGIVAYSRLGVDLFPKVDFPVCAVSTTLPGASAEEMESMVSKPIEEAVNSVSGINELRSISREGSSTVIVQFELAKDGDVGTAEVRDKVSGILRALPQGTDPPVVNKFDIDAAPIMTLAVSGRRDVRETTEIAKRMIQERLQTINGVGTVFVSGGRSRAINIIVDTEILQSYGLTIEEVQSAVGAQNTEVPGGIVAQGSRELVLRTLGRLKSAEEFAEIIVTSRKGFPIRIRDIGRAEDSVEEPRGLTRLNGREAVSLFVQKQSGTNTVAISDLVQEKLKEIQPSLPEDIKIEIIQDQARFIRNSLEEVKIHLLLAAFLVSATILFFIRDWRTTMIATMAIPVSIIPTFLFMWIMGFTLNNITMLGLILAIGVVIDDAVVVHENIFRRMEEYGEDAMTAARLGTKEIQLPVMATSLSLLVIFLPIAFMGGIVGRFFSSFGLTVAFAIAMSLFVSMTLTPMLCSRFLKLEASRSGTAASKSGLLYRWVDRSYGAALRWALRHRWLVAFLCLGVFISTGPIAMMLGANLVPRDDQSEFQVTYSCPEGYTLERSDQIVTALESRLATLPGVIHRFTVIGQNNGEPTPKGQGNVTKGSIYLRMKEIEERGYSQFDVMERARNILKEFPELRSAVTDVSAIAGSGQDTRLFQMILQGPDLKKLEEYSDAVRVRLSQTGKLSDVDTTLTLRKPELQVSIDRDRAGDLNMPVQSIAGTLSVLVGGRIISRFKEGTEQYDVWLRADRPFRVHSQTLDSIPLGKDVQLSAVARLNEERGPSQIDRFNRRRTVTILGNPDGGSLQDGVKEARSAVADLKLPPEYEVNFDGQAKMLGETMYYFLIALILSVTFMYLILAAQFESWVHPVSILSALPVTVPFGLVSLLMFQQPIDLYSLFGLFMLIGIVKKNGILQVDKTNELRRTGMAREQAIVEANHTRLRPILMTTLMLIAAMVPIALGSGPGAGARASMAKVIIGGQLLSLLLALLVTPVTYSLLDGMNRRVRGWLGMHPIPETIRPEYHRSGSA